MAEHSYSVSERLARLPLPAQRAFAVACAERTLAVYEADGYPSADVGIEALRKAIALLWGVLATGEAAPAERTSMRAEVESALPSREESSDGGTYLPTTVAGVTVFEAFDLALGSAEASAVRVAQTSIDAFDAFFETVGETRPSRHEEAWQEAAVNALEISGDELPTRRLFDHLPVPATELEVDEDDEEEEDEDEEDE